MAIVLTSTSAAHGFEGSNSATVNAGVLSETWNAPAVRSGSGERLTPTNPSRYTTQHLFATPQVTGYITNDYTLVVTKIVAANIYFEYDNHGYPVGAQTWSMQQMNYYVRQQAGGWHWTLVYTWSDPGYYSTVQPYYTVGVGSKTVFQGDLRIAPGNDQSIDILWSETNGTSPGVCTLNIRNTYSRPNPTPPTFSTDCRANPSNGNTLIFNAGGGWGYCENQNNQANYKIYDKATMATPIKSGSGTGGTFSGLSPNTRYWAKFTKNNGCFSREATCNAVTVTPNSLSNPTPSKFDTATVRLAVTNGGGVYKPTTEIYIKKCNSGTWKKAATSTTTSVATITLTGLVEQTCYQVQARTTTTAGTYIGNTVKFTTPKKGLCVADFTSIEPAMNEKTYEATAKVCYKWETNKVPATIVVRYQVKDGYDKTWHETEPFTTNDLTGERCITLENLYPNQTVYQTYIHTETSEAEYDSPMREFVTLVIPEPDIHNCENFTYLTELLCQSVKRLLHGNKTIYANPASQALCDPYSDDPTMLTLWSRALRLFHGMYCLVCDMGGARLTASKPGQYLVGEAGWQDIIKIINEKAEDENWKIATSNAIWKYIQDKLHEVWHYHGAVDVLVYDQADLSKFPTAKSAIIASENAIYRYVSGAWVKSTDPNDKIDDMGVWHINMESSTKVGYVQPGSAWYWWQGDWQPLDADVIAFAKIIDKMWEKKDQVVYNEKNADRLHVNVVDRNQFDCPSYPNGERWVTMITEPLSVPAPGYYEITFETGEQATIVQTQQVLAGALAQQPEDPTRTGYIFQGWNDKETGAAYDWAQPVHKNIAIQAVWDPQPVSVTFDITPATGDAPATITTVYGATINPLPDSTGFSLAGATFLGWQRDGVPFDTSTQVVGDTILRPRWSMDEFDIVFHPENGDADISIHLNYGEGVNQTSVPTPTPPTGQPLLFNGWWTAPGGAGTEFKFNTPLFGPADIYASYVPSHYTITFDSAGGSAVTQQVVQRGASGTMPKPDPTKSGKVFGGWMLNGITYEFDEPLYADITLVARWLNLYTVTFEDSFGDSLSNPQPIVEGTIITDAMMPTVPPRTGYTFAGWFRPDGSAFNPDTDPILSSIKLTALYMAAS